MAHIHLPKTFRFNLAATALGLHSMPLINAIEIMLMYVYTQDLKIFFKSGICGQKMTDPIEWIMDEEGNVCDILSEGKTHRFSASDDNKEVISASCYADGSNLMLSVSCFAYKAVGYYVLDETEMWVARQSFSIYDFYMEKNNFNAVMGRVGISQQSKAPQSKIKGPKKLEQREELLITWLCNKAGIPRTTDKKLLQECYTKIRTPTQEVVWGELNAFYPSLFTTGRDDFFGDQRVIRFAFGTGKGRPAGK